MRPRGPAPGVAPVTLLELRAALAAGASPAGALAAVALGADPDPALSPIARQVRLGRPLHELVRAQDTPGDQAAGLLLRALALAERLGSGAVAAVERTVDGAREEAALRRLLATRTVQARGTAAVLTLVPALAWVLLVVTDSATLRFYGQPFGALSGLGSGLLLAAGWWWSTRIVRRAGAAAVAADPLSPRPTRPDWRRPAAVAAPVALAGLAGGAPAAGLVTACAVGAFLWRPRVPAAAGSDDGGGAAEAALLVGLALEAGESPLGAVEAVSELAPPAARSELRQAARRLRAGWTVSSAFADGPLAAMGAVVAAAARWGSPAAPGLERLADDWRAERRAAAEAAAERAQLALVFPTTLLVLPAFVLGVVPPLLWSAFVR